MAAACGGTPTAPIPGGAPVPASASFEGVWEIEYRITQCDGLRHCGFFLNTTRKLTLRVARVSGAFDGVVLFSGTSIDVRGNITAGTLELRGSRPALSSSDYGFAVTRLDLRREGDAVTGAIEYTNNGPMDSTFYGRSRVGGPMTGVRLLGPATVNGFSGMWSGHAAVRDCSSIGWSECYPHRQRETHDVELTLMPSGSRVTGRLRVSGSTDIAVEGTTAGRSVTIHGTATEPNYAFDEVTTLRPSTLTLDAVGRLTGAIAFQIEWPPKLPDIWSYKITDFRVVELVSVALKPS